jgi:hypothetical protein
VDSRNRTVRRARVVRLVQDGSGEQSTPERWLEALIPAPSDELRKQLPACSLYAVKVAALALTGADVDVDRIRSARIVLGADGRVIAPADEEIYLPDEGETELHVPVVHPRLAADPDARQALQLLGVPVVSPASVLDARLDDPDLRRPGADWEAIWKLARRCTPEQVRSALEDHELDVNSVCARSVAGAWSRLAALLLPGTILKADDEHPEDRAMMLDTDWHGPELALFRELGITEGPVSGRGTLDEPWCSRYRDEMIQRFKARLKGQNVADTSLEFDGLRSGFAGPLTALEHLSDEAGARFAAEALRRTEQSLDLHLVHRTNSKLPPLRVPHPIVWFIQRRGTVPTSKGIVALEDAVGPGFE